MTRFRTGMGHDVHRLFSDKNLVLGGVTVSTDVGFDTHSGRDVLSHALVDALAGAIADGDLGTHYPEDDPDAEDARSLEFVLELQRLCSPRGIRDRERRRIHRARDLFASVRTSRRSAATSQTRWGSISRRCR